MVNLVGEKFTDSNSAGLRRFESRVFGSSTSNTRRYTSLYTKNCRQRCAIKIKIIGVQNRQIYRKTSKNEAMLGRRKFLACWRQCKRVFQRLSASVCAAFSMSAVSKLTNVFLLVYSQLLATYIYYQFISVKIIARLR